MDGNTYKKEVENFELNANERILEIQQELVDLEKKRAAGNLPKPEEQKLVDRIKFLVEEERLIMETRYKNDKDIKGVENLALKSVSVGDKDLKEILQNEIKEEQLLESELKEIKEATKIRMWYETWWGRLAIIIVGGLVLTWLGLEEVFRDF